MDHSVSAASRSIWVLIRSPKLSTIFLTATPSGAAAMIFCVSKVTVIHRRRPCDSALLGQCRSQRFEMSEVTASDLQLSVRTELGGLEVFKISAFMMLESAKRLKRSYFAHCWPV